MGKTSQVKAVPSQSSPLLIEKAQRDGVTTEVTLDAQVAAPVTKGQRLGTATVRAGEQVLAQIPLVAEAPVERLGFWDIFLHLLKNAVS